MKTEFKKPQAKTKNNIEHQEQRTREHRTQEHTTKDKHKINEHNQEQRKQNKFNQQNQRTHKKHDNKEHEHMINTKMLDNEHEQTPWTRAMVARKKDYEHITKHRNNKHELRRNNTMKVKERNT